jgi:hypothetical protein
MITDNDAALTLDGSALLESIEGPKVPCSKCSKKLSMTDRIFMSEIGKVYCANCTTKCLLCETTEGVRPYDRANLCPECIPLWKEEKRSLQRAGYANNREGRRALSKQKRQERKRARRAKANGDEGEGEKEKGGEA